MEAVNKMEGRFSLLPTARETSDTDRAMADVFLSAHVRRQNAVEKKKTPLAAGSF